MSDERNLDLFGNHSYRNLNNFSFLKNLNTILNSDNPFQKASGAELADIYFKEGWERFISRYSYAFNKFNALSREYKFQFFFISAFSEYNFLYNFIDKFFKDNKNLFDWKQNESDPLINFYNPKIYLQDNFKLIWFDMVKLGFPDELREICWEDFNDIVHDATGKYYFESNYNTEFIGDAHSIQPYTMSKKNVDRYLGDFLKFSPNKKNLLSSYNWSYWKSFNFVKTIADHDLDLLKLGPPSFHRNKSLINQLLKIYPFYYLKMKSRNLKKDKDITKSVITADPSFIDKIPRQYVGHISPFILAQGKGIKSKKYVAELKGVVCITGKTTSVDTKQDAKYLLEDHGYVVSDSLNKECNYLLNETGGKTSKSNKIKKYPYSHIIEIKRLSDLIEN